ncbi:MAG: hypothetical protein JWL81_2932 [Verrucomicrobiales bacterium]|nr:hypothetical protein [Verrucomicrobiales bacterium]
MSFSLTAASTPSGLPCAEEGRLWLWSGHPTLAAIRTAGQEARAFLGTAGLPEEDLGAWELLLAEAGNNVALHGGEDDPDQVLDIEIFIFKNRVTARLTDRTEGFTWPDEVSLPDDDAESGRGLFIMEALTSSRSYQRHPCLNILTLERAFEGLPPAAAPAPAVAAATVPDPAQEEILDAMTEELSACYESLSAIFRFTAEARQCVSLTDFANRLLQHLVTVTGADCGMLRVVSGEDLTTIAANGCESPEACRLGQSPVPFENIAVATRQDHWIEADPARPSGQPQAGLIHPFFNEDELMGVLSIGRHHSSTPLDAGQVNIIHTFAEFFTQQVLSRRHAESAIKASIAHRELELAAEIQRSLLPYRLPVIPGLTLAGHCESALTVGGDFYDVIPWNNLGFFFVVGDVMGKGVGASMMAAVTRSVFRSLNQLHQTPARAMERAGRLLYDDLDRLEMFVTAAIGVVDLHLGVVRIANAGHCPVLVSLPDGTVVSAEPTMAPLGLDRNPACQEFSVPFLPGARLLAYSDGLIDPRDGRSPFPAPEDAAAWMAAHAPGHGSADDLKAALLQQIGCIPSEGPSTAQADDQTFLIITRESLPD